MNSLIVTPQNDGDYKFLNELLKKLGYTPHVIYEDKKEDIALLSAMLMEKKGDYVEEAEIMKILGDNAG